MFVWGSLHGDGQRRRRGHDLCRGPFPSRHFAINTAWAQLVAISADLIAWLRLLALAPELAKAEPKSAALPAPACPGQTDHRRVAAAADPIELAMGHSDRDRVRQDRRDPGTRLNDLYQTAQPTKDPRRTATRKRQPGLRHTH